MSDVFPNDPPLSVTAAQRVDEVCDRFEKALLAGQKPRIEAYLVAAEEPERSALLHELVRLDIEYRRQAGEKPRHEDYRERFPGFDLAPLPQPPTTHDDIATPNPSTTNPEMTTASAEAVDSHLRYLPLRFHAKGGLGEVFVARDEQLQREVALKRMKAEHADHPDSRQRFMTEAEVTSRLEHPGVVPVHGLARDREGRPCYAMRFIQGETLQEAIRRFHEADKPARDPGERGLALRQLLSRFIAVCNTVAYAHSRGILHRDLKPANIMVGKYGETLVVDWGLAKPFARTEVERTTGEETLRPTAEKAGSGTLLGQAVGTPAYMSPEQAAGQPLSPASDIFGLGATLYAIVTGQPPYQGERVLDKARLGKLIPPRQIKKDVPRELEAVCLKAMALDPQERYGTALELAADVEHWLADEPVTAYGEPRILRLRRWARRHRALMAGAAVLLLTAAVGLAVGLVAVNHQKNLTQQALLEKSQALTEVTQANRRVKGALEASKLQVFEIQMSKEGWKLRPAMEDYLNQMLQYYQTAAAQAEADEFYRESLPNLYRWIGNICHRLGQERAAEEAYRQAIAFGEKLVTDVPERFLPRRENLAHSHINLGVMMRSTGRLEEAQTSHRAAIAIYQQLAADFPDEPNYLLYLARAQTNLGILLHAMGRHQKAQVAYRNAVVVCKQLAADFPMVPEFRQQLAASQTNLGVSLQASGHLQEAEATFRDAFGLFKELAAESPVVP